jgi:hypothetical protein
MTKPELVRRVLLKHRALDAEENPTPRDEADVLAVYHEQYAELLADGLVTWDVDGVIPDDAAGAMVKIVAAETADMYSAPPVDKSSARRDLARIMAADYVPSTTTASYF